MTHRATSQSTAASGTTCTIPKPTGLAVGDLMIAQVWFRTNAAISAPDGTWTLIRNDQGGTTRSMSLFWKIATSDDVAATNFAFTSSSAGNNGAIHAFSAGFNTSTPINANNGQSNASGTTTSGAVTPSVANCAVMLFTGAQNDDAAPFSGYAIVTSDPGGWTEVVDGGGAAINNSDIGAAFSSPRIQTTSTGNGSVTFTTSRANITQIIAIAPYVNQAPTIALNTADNTETTDTTPTVEFTGTDADSDDIQYQIQFDTVSSFDSQAGNPLLDKVSGTDSGFANTVNGADTSPFTSGQKVSFTVQAGDALPLGTIYYRARPKDPSGSNTDGDWSETRKIHIYTTTREASISAVSSIPTDANHPYSDSALALTSSQYTAIDTDDASRLAKAAGAATKAYLLQKTKIASQSAFTLDFNGQVDNVTTNEDVVYDTASSLATTSDISSQISFSHTVTTSGSNRILLVGISWNHANTVNSVTYGGQSMTIEGSIVTNGNVKTVLYKLLNPPTGANNVVVTASAVGQAFSVGAISFTSVNQTTPFEDLTTSTGTLTGSGSISETITTASTNTFIVDLLAFSATTSITAGAGQTERWDAESSSSGGAASTKPTTSKTDYTTGWNNDTAGSTSYARIAFAMKGVSTSPSIKVDLWNFTTSAWVNQSDTTSPVANTDFSVNISKSVGFTDFCDSNGWIYSRVYADYTPSVSLSIDEFVAAESAGGEPQEANALFFGTMF